MCKDIESETIKPGLLLGHINLRDFENQLFSFQKENNKYRKNAKEKFGIVRTI